MPTMAPAQAPSSGLSLATKVGLTVLCVPVLLALGMFWQLVRPSVIRAIARIDISNPELVAIVGALLLSAGWLVVFVGPLYLIWRKR